MKELFQQVLAALEELKSREEECRAAHELVAFLFSEAGSLQDLLIINKVRRRKDGTLKLRRRRRKQLRLRRGKRNETSKCV